MKTRTSIFAVVVFAFAAVAVASPTTYLTLVSSDGTGLTVVSATGAAPGSYVEGVVTIDGLAVVTDIAPVDPMTGEAMVIIPTDVGSDPRVVLHDAGGVVVDTVSSYVGGLEND